MATLKSRVAALEIGNDHGQWAALVIGDGMRMTMNTPNGRLTRRANEADAAFMQRISAAKPNSILAIE